MVWGLVFSYIEGRRTTEFMGSVLAISFIFSSGFVKSIGKWLMNDMHVDQFWMPVATGAIFVIPLLFFVFLLEQIPAPSQDDIEHRTERLPMTAKSAKIYHALFTRYRCLGISIRAYLRHPRFPRQFCGRHMERTRQ